LTYRCIFFLRSCYNTTHDPLDSLTGAIELIKYTSKRMKKRFEKKKRSRESVLSLSLEYIRRLTYNIYIFFLFTIKQMKQSNLLSFVDNNKGDTANGTYSLSRFCCCSGDAAAMSV